MTIIIEVIAITITVIIPKITTKPNHNNNTNDHNTKKNNHHHVNSNSKSTNDVKCKHTCIHTKTKN